MGAEGEVPVRENGIGVPFLLRAAMALGAVFGVLGTGIGLWVLFRVILSAGPFRVNEEMVSRAEFLTVALPLVGLYVSACITAGAASWAIWRQRAYSRALLTTLLAEFVIGDTAMLVMARRLFDAGASELAVSVFFFTVLVALGLWYLYRKESVVRYYASIR